jgi:RND superfamily putative drug exporter
MTARLARLADFAYRRRRRMLLIWLIATPLILAIGFGNAGKNKADYDTPNSASKAAGDLLEKKFDYVGQDINVVWKDPAGATSPAVKSRIDQFLAEAQKVKDVGTPTPVRVSENGQIATTTLGLTARGWDVPKSSGEDLIALANKYDGNGLELKLGGDPIYAAQAQSSPEGIGFFGAAIVLLIAFGSVVAAGLPLMVALFGLGISSALISVLANVIDVPDWTTAVSGLNGIGVGIDYSLLVLTRFRSALREGKDRHDAVVEAVTTAGRSVIIAGATVVISVLGLMLTGLS